MAKHLDDVRDLLPVKHYSIQTEKAYIHWIKKYIFFQEKRPAIGASGWVVLKY